MPKKGRKKKGRLQVGTLVEVYGLPANGYNGRQGRCLRKSTDVPGRWDVSPMDSQQCIPVLGVNLKPVTSGEGTAEADKCLGPRPGG
jgi:hypothetical protein